MSALEHSRSTVGAVARDVGALVEGGWGRLCGARAERAVSRSAPQRLHLSRIHARARVLKLGLRLSAGIGVWKLGLRKGGRGGGLFWRPRRERRTRGPELGRGQEQRRREREGVRPSKQQHLLQMKRTTGRWKCLRLSWLRGRRKDCDGDGRNEDEN